MNIEITAKRLKELRTENGYSHERLAVALQEKYQIKITSASLKKYEIAEQHHSNYGAVKGMRIEYLYMFADFYNVSSDYILGFTNARSVDVTEKAIYENIGLSPASVKNLASLWKNKNNNSYSVFVFDFMLSNLEFIKDFSQHLLKYCEYDTQGLEMVRKCFVGKEKEKNKQDLDNKRNELDTKKGIQRYLTINVIENFISNFSSEFYRIKFKLGIDNDKIKIFERWGDNGNKNK